MKIKLDDLETIVKLDAEAVEVWNRRINEKRSKGCEYCKGNEDQRKCISLETDVGETWISEDNRLENSYDSCEINFCPMCGRPLKGADNE